MEKTMFRDKGFLKQLLMLALPLMLQNLINSSLSLVDTAMVGMLGQNELAAVSLANTPFFIAMFFGFGVQGGAAVLISQYWGKRDITTINRVFGVAMMTSGVISLLFSLAVFLFPMQIMSITTDNQELVAIAAEYGKTVAFSYFFNGISIIYIGLQRSTENPRFGMYTLIVSMLLNTFLNWVMIFGNLGFPKMGVAGAALATLISRIVEFLIVVGHMIFSKRLKLMPSVILRPGAVIVKDFIKYASPVILNEVFWSLGVSFYPIIFGHMEQSADIVAAYSISGNIERIVGVVAFGISGAAAILVGKAIGGGATKEHVYKMGLSLNVMSALSGVVTGVALLLVTRFAIGPFVYPLFGLTPNAEAASTMMLSVMAFFLPFRYFTITNIVGVWRGGGDVKSGMYLDIGTIYLYAVPLAALTALVLKWDIMWVYLLISSEELIKAVIGVRRFRSKKWIHNVTRDMSEPAAETK